MSTNPQSLNYGNKREESVIVRNGAVAAADDGVMLHPDIIAWLTERGVHDDINECTWWSFHDDDTGNHARVWIANLETRLLFKLTWGGW